MLESIRDMREELPSRLLPVWGIEHQVNLFLNPNTPNKLAYMINSRRLYAKKCTFCVDHCVFLRFVISTQGIQVDENQAKIIKGRPTPITKVKSFHGLASFNKRFVQDFSTIAAPLIIIIKKNDKLQ